MNTAKGARGERCMEHARPSKRRACLHPGLPLANRAEFPCGGVEIEAFLTRKWRRERDYRLIKELWGFCGNRTAVLFAYEFRDDSGQWFRAYGNENWQFDADGLRAALREHQ